MKKFFAFIIVTMVSMSAMAQSNINIELKKISTGYEITGGEINLKFAEKQTNVDMVPIVAAMNGWKAGNNISYKVADKIAEADGKASSVKLEGEGSVIVWRDADGNAIYALPYMVAVANGYSIK